MVRMQKNVLGLLLALGGSSAAAQVTGSGTSGRVPLFTGESSIGDSPIAVSGSNVGIGTANPTVAIDVNSSAPQLRLVGTGETSELRVNASFGGAVAAVGTVNDTPMYLTTWNTPRIAISPTGNVGIGTMSPDARLEVNGNINLTAGTGASMTYQDGTVQSTAWTGVLSGGDHAESVNVSGSREMYEPGDVLVIDSSAAGRFLKSSTPYATTVTGIYSTKPGIVGRRQHTAQEQMKEEVPMAMTGIVPTRVSAENGPIRPGDLLVTSSKSGYAMKGTDRSQMLGAVIGKAIGYLDSGFGIVEAVVTLQ